MDFIGIDLGTSAMKLLLVGGAGEIKAVVSKEYPLLFPRPAWSEQEPAVWWDALLEGVTELLDGRDRTAVAGIGVGGQMHGLVCLDAEDCVIRPAILWNDGRTAVEYGRSIGFTGDFYIEPKPKEPMKHQYDFDAATAIGFLRQYGLDRDFKLNIEANHATLAGHTFQHDLRISAIHGMLGSIDANQGDTLLGWDTDEFPFNVYDAAMCMYEVLKCGGLTGGFNFDSKARRPSYTAEDMFHAYILGMDTFALGLIKAAALIEDGRLDRFIEDRYASYRSGVGAKIRSGKATLAELAAYADAMGAPALPGSGRQEYLESIVNQVLFGSV